MPESNHMMSSLNKKTPKNLSAGDSETIPVTKKKKKHPKS